MVGYMNREALEKTLESGRAVFYSRSKQRLWMKGETSGHVLFVKSVVADCDADTLLLLVDPQGPTCHTGRPSCFFRQVQQDGSLEDQASEAVAFLQELEQTIQSRRSSTAQKSYTRFAAEAADLLYHILVGLRLRDVSLRAVIEALHRRTHMSGHAEKAARTPHG